MKFAIRYLENKETKLKGRYITNHHIIPILEQYKSEFTISTIGKSVLRNDIYLIKIGTGKKVVLGWSQMHGNESTTTKAIFDFIKYIANNKDEQEVTEFLNTFSFYVIPILNPDGAAVYTRENANKIDLNRDAKQLSQPESVVLRDVFNKVQPQLCLNLHDQRSIFGFETGKPAIISFLAPAADPEQTITVSRKIAMQQIVVLASKLQAYIPGCVGRYDDTFNINCVGDTFQQFGVPTILFEAGHTKRDYNREITRKYLFFILLQLFVLTEANGISATYKDYFLLPENIKNYKDVILRNVRLQSFPYPISIGIQYKEILKGNTVKFVPEIESIGDLSNFYAHKEIDVAGSEILINNQKNIKIGDVISSIVNKNNKSLKYF